MSRRITVDDFTTLVLADPDPLHFTTADAQHFVAATASSAGLPCEDCNTFFTSEKTYLEHLFYDHQGMENPFDLGI